MQSATLPEIIVPRTPDPARPTARTDQSDTPFAATLDQVHQDQERQAKPAHDDDAKPTDQASRPADDGHDADHIAAANGTTVAKDGKPGTAKPAKPAADQTPDDPTAPVVLTLAPMAPVIPVEVAATPLTEAKPVAMQALPDAPPLAGTAPVVADGLSQPPLPVAPGALPTAAPVGPGEIPGQPNAATQAATLAAQLAALAQAGKNTAPAAPAAKPSATPAEAAAPADASLIATLTAVPVAAVPNKDAKGAAETAASDEATAAAGAASATATVALPTPTLSAASTPATKIQASAITLGDKKRVVPETATSETATGKSGSAFDALAQQQVATTAPTAPTAPVQRPLSETIAAQDSLAAAGNAAEKAVSQQVGKALVQTLPGGDKMMVLRLTPPELGTVRIEVTEHQGVLSARLHAEDDGVRVALERFLPQMQRDLRLQDAPIQEVTLSDQTQFDRSFADTSRQPRDQDGSARSGRDDGPAFAVDGAARSEDAVGIRRSLGGQVGTRGVDAFA